jgi:hypothetical protein
VINVRKNVIEIFDLEISIETTVYSQDVQNHSFEILKVHHIFSNLLQDQYLPFFFFVFEILNHYERKKEEEKNLYSSLNTYLFLEHFYVKLLTYTKTKR